MLSVIRELAEEAEARAPEQPAIGELLVDLVRRGEAAVARTPEQLQVLRDAGVVDAGGAGPARARARHRCSRQRRGASRGAAGRKRIRASRRSTRSSRATATARCSSSKETTSTARRSRSSSEKIGDSLLVVGDEQAIKVHVHTDDPGAALSIGTAAGTIDRIEIANMHEQTLEREKRPSCSLGPVPDVPAERATTGVVAVVAGDGNRRLFESLAKDVGPLAIVEGGQTMNPSTADLLAAVQSLDADEAVILPNNSNVLLAAEHAAANADRPVEVVAADSIPGGLAAMVAFDGQRTAAENAAEMREAVAAVDTGEVTIASRDVQMNGLSIRKGDWLGLYDGEPIAGGDSFDEVAGAVVDRLLARPRDLLTLLVGEDEQPLDGLLERVSTGHPGRRRGRPAGRPAPLSPPAFRRVDSLRPWGGRSGSCSSRTTRSFAKRSSFCSACARTSRSSPPSATAPRPHQPRSSIAPTSC